MSFVPCSACHRHVRVDDPTCPFCGAGVDAGEIAAPTIPPGRHGRVARMAFGAGLLFTVTACPAYGTPDDRFDGGPIEPPRDAAVATDAGHDAGEDAGEEDAGESDAGEADAGEADVGDGDAG